MNRKRIYRRYKAEGLNLRTKRPHRRKSAGNRRVNLIVLTVPDQGWSIDFVSDALFDGRKCRSLTTIYNFSRGSLVIEVDQSPTGEDVVRVLTKIARERNQNPKRIQEDNGLEFVSLAIDKWTYEKGVVLNFSHPGKPTYNPFNELLNGSFRNKCLNAKWIMSLKDARKNRMLEAGLQLFQTTFIVGGYCASRLCQAVL